ncbi:MAG: hypothetical protein OXU77_14280 [Gammaproteobacteria bacterium]|nr:hypothetical protein [Gammaproteobacteria bacterium]MDE0441672.1 hypothetical protein [Gammaproteobacteria bacterium]
MQVLFYDGLDPDRIPGFAKMASHLEAENFAAAESKKVGDNLFRAKLDRSDRILFSFARHRDRTVILVLEHIRRHAYGKSRFLVRGATVDEAKLPDLEGLPTDALSQAEPIPYVNPRRPRFHLLDKAISFDDDQIEVFSLPAPLVVVGSAGSGKTVLTLEKMKQAPGNVLYVTHSPFLVDRSRETYYGLNYENDDQEVSFLSFDEFVESIRVPSTRAIDFAGFARWFARHRVASRLKDPHRLFEEIAGVIAGSTADSAWLSAEAYARLGVRQSIYPAEERGRVHDLFLKYVDHLKESGQHDINILSFEYRALAQPVWDFVVVDEVQDFTNVQMDLVLRTLKDAGNFILCGDANQIVHPSYFSWTGVRRYFHGRLTGDEPVVPRHVLGTNYRNAAHVTELANRILRLKHARFGSIDRESNHLVKSVSERDGSILLLAEEPGSVRELDEKTHDSTRFAVIVMHPEQKAAARRCFRTPLVFSIQEAKGLEYENVILFGFVSGDEERFREIASDVDIENVRSGELRYARARDKSDKSLEIFKFHINALYVAVTRAIANVYLVESTPRQRLFDLLGIELSEGPLDLERQASSLADWQREAQKLERQGRDEQATEIRNRILDIQETPWEPLTRDALYELADRALGGGGRKTMLELFDYALLGRDRSRLAKLRKAGFRGARQPEEAATKALIQRRFVAYTLKRPDAVRNLVEKYGVDHRDRFNFTPAMLAARFGNDVVAAMLADMGAKLEPVNSAGSTAFQIMLAEAFVSARYAERSTPALFRRLTPGSVSVTVDERLVKLHDHQAEFLFYNLFVALFQTRTADSVSGFKLGLRAADLEEALGRLSPAIVPPYRTRRAYISGVLAKNEKDRDQPYNRRLFKRTQRGFYILNPALRVRVGKEWVPIYELLDPETLFCEAVVPRQLEAMVQRTRQTHRQWCMAAIAGDDPGPPPF